MKTEEWTPTQSRVEAVRLDYFYLFYCKQMDNRDKFCFFNKVLLSSVPVLFTL